jgi:hypothetical protein
MQNMLKDRITSLRRRSATRTAVRRRPPEPMPRIRWYS